MRPDPCRAWRERLGAAALGHLEADEAVALRAHLDGCSACRAEADELGRVVSLLPLVDAERVMTQPRPPADLGARVVSRVAEQREVERRAHRKRGVVRLVAGLAAALAVAAATWILVTDGDGASPVEFGTAPEGVVAAATVDPRPWGTEIELDVAGLPGGEPYRVWLERRDGERIPAGTFVAVPDREMHLVLAAGLELSAASGLGVSTEDGETVLYSELSGARR